MRGRPFENSSAVFNKNKDYLIIAYRYRIDVQDGEYDRGEEYLILDDDFTLHYFEKEKLHFSDNDNSNFIEVEPTDNYYKVFIDSDFINIYDKSLLKDSRLEFNFNIWDRTWLAKSLQNKGVELNEELKEALYDETYKLTFISGFLDFASEYINFEHNNNPEYSLIFYKEYKSKSHLRFETDNFEKITNNKESYIINKIKHYLFINNKIENNYDNISYKLVRKLYLMIDCIFINKLNGVYNYNEGHWSNLLIFDYDDIYYILNFKEYD